MRELRWVVFTLALSLAGCAANEIITGTGSGTLDTYLKTGKSKAQASGLAKRAAALTAQRDLIERYAGTFLSSEAQVNHFVTQGERIIAATGGLVKGVRVVRVERSPDQTTYHVVVRAALQDLLDSLGDGPQPKPALTSAIVWPDEVGGGPVATGE